MLLARVEWAHNTNSNAPTFFRPMQHLGLLRCPATFSVISWRDEEQEKEIKDVQGRVVFQQEHSVVKCRFLTIYQSPTASPSY